MGKYIHSLQIAAAALIFLTTLQIQAQYYQVEPAAESCFPDQWCIDKGFISGNLLYLRAFEDGLSNPFEPLSIIENCNDSEYAFTAIGKGKEPKFKWDLGYRIGTGIDFRDSTWRIGAFWTHFWQDRTKGNCHRPSWKLEYDTIDVIIGYQCKFNSCFTLDAFGGLRAAQINQKLRGHFVNSNLASISSERVTVLNKKVKQDFDGIGFIFGLVGEFAFDNGFTFFLQGDAGTLTGCNHINSVNKFSFGSESRTALKYKRHQEACQYFVDSAIGVRWQTCLCANTNFFMELGFESHNYFNHNRMNSEGNLCINGGNLTLGLQF